MSLTGRNQRLVRTFNIDNALTTIDDDYHKTFAKDVTHPLRTNMTEWAELLGFAIDGVRHALEKGNLQEGILLVPLVQLVVFKIVLERFFTSEAVLENDAAVATATKCINLLWLESKREDNETDSRAAAHLIKLQRSLQQALVKVLPKQDMDVSRHNPLNIILPAYETLWRIILRRIIEILFCRHSMSRTGEQCFADFANNKYRLGQDSNEPTRSTAAALVNETLRLYPLTRRVYRWVQMNSPHATLNEQSEMCAADVEALHRCTDEPM